MWNNNFITCCIIQQPALLHLKQQISEKSRTTQSQVITEEEAFDQVEIYDWLHMKTKLKVWTWVKWCVGGGGGGEKKKIFTVCLFIMVKMMDFKVSRAPLGTSLTADGPPWLHRVYLTLPYLTLP